MSNFYYELDVESVLQCPVCYELPQHVIYLCKVGHHMCDKCRKRLTLCPTCQSALTGSRNFLAEALISKFSIFKEGGDAPNNNNALSNTIIPTPEKLQDNRNPLKPLPLFEGAFKCLLESCRNRKEMGAGNLLSHVEKIHSHLFEKFQNHSATFSHNFESFCLMKGKRKFHRAFRVSNMGLFFLNLAVLEDNYINCWLSSPVPVRKTKNFDYELQFSKENDDNKLTFISKVASNLQSHEWLLARGRVFIISPKEHKMKENDFFSLFIKIVFKTPSL